MGFSLYSWQQSCIKEWLSIGSRGVVQVVTGAGKTILALYAAKALQEKLGKPVELVIIVPKTFLVTQWKASILSHQQDLGIKREDIGWVQGNHHQVHNRRVMIYVVNSARYTLSSTLHSLLTAGKTVLVIADECHHYASAENRKIFSFLDTLDAKTRKRFHSFGLSATPQVHGFATHLVPALGPLFYTYGFTEAIRDGVINQVVIHNVELAMTQEQDALYGELCAKVTSTLHRLTNLVPYLKKLKGAEFFLEIQNLCTSKHESIAETARLLIALFHQRRALVNLAPQRITCTVDLVKLLDSRSKIIIFGERISQSEELYALLKRRYPKEVVHYHSELGETERTLALKRYRSGEARILVSCKALDEGLDIPSADVGIILSSTSEQRQRIQRLGRILRRQEGKLKASLFYLCLGNTVEDANLLDEGLELVEEWYLTYTDHFIHPVYDELADDLVLALYKKGATVPGLDALIERGRVRSDWCEDPDSLKNLAQGRDERYYTLMRSLSLLRIRNGV